MQPRELIELVRLDASDPPKLTVLKSKYNRYASKLNMARFEKQSGEHTFLLDELEVLKKQIDQYD
jgi:hypothetical protein